MVQRQHQKIKNKVWLQIFSEKRNKLFLFWEPNHCANETWSSVRNEYKIFKAASWWAKCHD